MIHTSGIDTLIAKSFENAIRGTLGEKALWQIHDILFEKYGIPTNKAFENFEKLDSVLHEIFGTKTEEIERQIIGRIFVLGESKRSEGNWLIIENEVLTKIILESIGDHDKKKILNTVLDEPRVISDILTMNNLPQTSGYRKVNALIQNGMLIPHGFVFMYDGKKVTKYKSVFENIVIMIEKDKLTIRVLPTPEAMEKSMIIQLAGSRFNYGHITYMR